MIRMVQPLLVLLAAVHVLILSLNQQSYVMVAGYMPPSPTFIVNPTSTATDDQLCRLHNFRRSVSTGTMFHLSDSNNIDIDFIERKQFLVSKPTFRSTNSRVQRITIAQSMFTFFSISALLSLFLFPNPVLAVESTSTVLIAQTWYSSFTSTGFYQAFSLVFLSELGDKTFFIAGLLAMKTSRIISLIGSLGALIVMTILSVIIGQVFHVLPTFGGIADGVPLDDIAAAIAFAFFGIKILKEALEMDDGSSMMDEEFAEAEETVKDNENNVVLNQNRIGQIASIFGLVFAAEFGDRSFVSTIALSAAQNPFSVAGGAIAAHAVATGIAVAGGSVVAKYLSEKVIGLIGGTLFLVFAATTVLGIF
jgi:putative Ca2+/H+ antiporter (TMEM165/GDT1 family)